MIDELIELGLVERIDEYAQTTNEQKKKPKKLQPQRKNSQEEFQPTTDEGGIQIVE